MMDRTIQLKKKFTSEFNSSENTMEVHSLQQVMISSSTLCKSSAMFISTMTMYGQVGFLFSVCHTVILVQDWIIDINLTR